MATVGPKVWTPPAADGVLPSVFPDTFEVRVLCTDTGPKLVAAIELISPGNKDRPAERRAFATKCASYLYQGISVIIVDIVTNRRANLHNEILRLMEAADLLQLPPESNLYAVAYRPLRRGQGDEIDVWRIPSGAGPGPAHAASRTAGRPGHSRGLRGDLRRGLPPQTADRLLNAGALPVSTHRGIPMQDTHQYLDPLTLAKVRSLEMQARLIVEGYLSGMHKSPYHGFSVEFAQHREYVPGDDLKHLDWKVYSRTGRFYLKQYEEETNLACWLLVDASESMRYGSGPTRPDGKPVVTKYDYACMAAAALAYLILHQQDSAGLVTYDNQVRQLLRPSSQPSHLKQMVNILNKGAGRERTRPGADLPRSGRAHHAPRHRRRAQRLVRRAGGILTGLKHLRHKRHEVIVMHVLDRAELEFPFQEATLFRGLEQMPELLTDPRSLRDGYLEQIQTFIAELQRGCLTQNIDYVRCEPTCRWAWCCRAIWRIACAEQRHELSAEPEF